MMSGCDVLFFRNDPLVARVQGRRLHVSDVKAVLGESPSAQSRDQFIEHWINQQLWDIEAKKHIHIDTDIRDLLQEYKSSIIIRKYQENYILNKIMIHENDVLKYYTDHQNEFITHRSAAFVEIYSAPSLSIANDIVANLKKQERPAISPQIELIHRGTCIEPIDKAVFSKDRKNIIGPLSHSNQYYVVLIIEYYAENSLLRVEHVRNDIIQKLQITARTNALQQKQKELKDHINVKIFKTSDN